MCCVYNVCLCEWYVFVYIMCVCVSDACPHFGAVMSQFGKQKTANSRLLWSWDNLERSPLSGHSPEAKMVIPAFNALGCKLESKVELFLGLGTLYRWRQNSWRAQWFEIAKKEMLVSSCPFVIWKRKTPNFRQWEAKHLESHSPNLFKVSPNPRDCFSHTESPEGLQRQA